MKREDIIKALKEYFDIRELVCPHMYNTYGESRCWQFFTTPYLHTLLVIRRDILKVGMTSNNWHKGGSRSESGIRCNLCSIPKAKTLKGLIYMSAHCLGEALDSILTKMTAEEARKKIVAEKDKLPYNIRLEDGVSWLHFDIYDTGNKVYLFKA